MFLSALLYTYLKYLNTRCEEPYWRPRDAEPCNYPIALLNGPVAYGPLALLPTFSRVLEKYVSGREAGYIRNGVGGSGGGL